ncbi:MAG: class I SAM-dependent methyltransferase [Gammaproteobacteria bacterium]|nr:class I SAM-dependent methyltransferase [Gammaproteobacteria bacterium]
MTDTENSEGSPVDWYSYARCYDLLCELNPAYSKLIAAFRDFLEARDLNDQSRILDIGGGTGNFFKLGLPDRLRRARLAHLDANGAMLDLARSKYADASLEVELIHADASQQQFQPRSLDCVVTVNALYAMRHPRRVIRNIHQALKPGGCLFFVNLGRIQNTLDWTLYLLAKNLFRLGPRRTLSILRNEGSVISKANQGIAEAQRNKQYWRHGTAEIGEFLAEVGFRIDELRPCYRGYSDLAICTKPNLLSEIRDARIGSESRSQSLFQQSQLSA